MTFWVYLTIAALAAIGLLQTMRRQARSRRYLEGSPDEDPLQISHLSGRLQAVVRDTRALRLSLEGPLRELAEGSSKVILGEHDELQQHLHEAAREIGEWVLEVERLGPSDLAYLHDVGAQPEHVRGILEQEGWSLERKRRRDQPPLEAQLERIVRELELFEQRLQTPPNPYR